MQPYISCENPTKGTLSFYLCTDEGRYYLFSNEYRKGVANFFQFGLRLDAAHDFSKCRYDTAVTKVLSKFPSYIKYIEKEYGISVLRQTQKRANNDRKAPSRTKRASRFPDYFTDDLAS